LSLWGSLEVFWWYSFARASVLGTALAATAAMKQLTCLLAISLVVAACSSSEDDGPQTAADFCSSWAEAACSDEVLSVCQAAGVDDCRRTQTASCMAQLPPGEYSGQRAEQCLDAVEAAFEDADITADEVGAVFQLRAPCDQLVRGFAGEGQECTSREDCDAPAGYDCVFKGDQQLTGTCRLPVSVGAGQDCSAPEAACGAGFYCDGENCIAGESAGEACSSHRQCSSTTFCSLTSVCEARLPLNQACGFDEQCASGLCYEFSPTRRVCTDRVRLSPSEPICDDLR
jgi:hypothetical protein